MGNIEKFPSNSPEGAEHDKVLEGMFAEAGEEIVKIISVGDKEGMATVQFGKDGDIEPVSIKKLRMLIRSDDVVSRWEGTGGLDEQESEEKLAA